MFPEIRFPTLLVGNSSSNSALCTLWTPVSNFQQHLWNYALIGELHYKKGIPYMLYNLANSNINKLIVWTQNDINNELCQELSGGLDKYEYWKHLKEHVVITFTNNYEYIVAPQPKDYEREKIHLHVHPCTIKETEKYVLADDPGYIISDPDPLRCRAKALKKILLFGHDTGDDTREILTLMVNTDSRLIKSSVDGYEECLLDGDKPDGLSYTYGNRINLHFGRSQIESCISRLKNKYTRKAYISLCDPFVDYDSYDMPCLVSIMFKIGRSDLHMTAVFRSHDIYNAWLDNYSALATLHRHIVVELNRRYNLEVSPGKMSVISNSAHIYNKDLSNAESISRATITTTILDKITVSFLKCDSDEYAGVRMIEYVAVICDEEGNEIRKLFNTTKYGLSKMLEPYIGSPQHALYVGQQLEAL